METENEPDVSEPLAIQFGWKKLKDGTWAKGRGRNYQRVSSAADVVAREVFAKPTTA